MQKKVRLKIFSKEGERGEKNETDEGLGQRFGNMNGKQMSLFK